MRWFICVLALLFLCDLATRVDAATFVVRPDGLGSYPTIQAAVDHCVDGDVVELANGVFIGPGNRDVDYLGKAITIRSQSGDPSLCVMRVSPNHEDVRARGFLFDSGEGPGSVLDGVTIEDGSIVDAVAGGGGICCRQSSPTIRNCIFLQNEAFAGAGCPGLPFGGGAYFVGSASTLTACTFIENWADGDWEAGPYNCHRPAHGGGLYAENSTLSLVDCVFENNRVIGEYYETHGAAIYQRGGSVSVVVGGVANTIDLGFAGALVWVDQGTLRISGSELRGGAGCSGEGAIIEAVNTSVELDHVTIHGFRGDFLILIDGSGPSLTVESSTIAYNSRAIPIVYAGPLVLRNTIIAHNEFSDSPVQCAEAVVECSNVFRNGHDPNENTCELNWSGCLNGLLGINGNICVEPLFCDMANGDLRLDGASPCLPGHHPDGWHCGLIGALPIGCPTANAEDGRGVSEGSVVIGVAPNPFEAETTIRLWIPAVSSMESIPVVIYDAGGRRLRTLVAGAERGAQRLIFWDGTDAAGRQVPTGVYFCQVASGGGARGVPILRVR